MLSRTARRIYWMARYIERVENTARLVNTYHFLLLDLPRGTQVGWEVLPYISGGFDQFIEHYQRHDERNTVKFLLSDDTNPGSLINSIANARENSRTSREVLPGPAWEQMNELQLFATAHIDDALPRKGRFDYLTEIIHRCQQLTGLLAGAMSHDNAYDLLLTGRYIERADMTTRVVDIGAMSLKKSDETGSLDIHVWTSILRALSAYQMYRKDVQHGVHCADVVSYLFKSGYFPRSVAYCLNRIEECLGDLPLYKNTLKPLRETQRSVGRLKPEKLNADSLHDEVDRLQIGISDVHDCIRDTLFD